MCKVTICMALYLWRFCVHFCKTIFKIFYSELNLYSYNKGMQTCRIYQCSIGGVIDWEATSYTFTHYSQITDCTLSAQIMLEGKFENTISHLTRMRSSRDFCLWKLKFAWVHALDPNPSSPSWTNGGYKMLDIEGV